MSWLASSLLVGTWGCGSSSSNGTTSGSDGGSAPGGSAPGGSATGGNATGGSGGGSTGGSATGGDGGNAASGGTAGGRSLTIQVYDIAATNGAHLTVMDTTPEPSRVCTTLRRESCAVTTCSSDAGIRPADDVWFTGGEVVTVTIDRTGPTAGESPQSKAALTLQPMMNVHASTFTPHTFLLGEQQVTVDISGGTLPPHHYVAQFPVVLITTTAPDESSAGAFDVDYVHLSRQADRVLEWQRGAPNVIYRVSQKQWQEADGKWYALGCSFDSTLGTGTVPGELLASLPTGTELYTMAVIDDSVQVDGGTYRFLIYADTVNPAEQNAVELKLTD